MRRGGAAIKAKGLDGVGRSGQSEGPAKLVSVGLR